MEREKEIEVKRRKEAKKEGKKYWIVYIVGIDENNRNM